MSYKVILPGGKDEFFNDERSCVQSALEFSAKLNKVLSIKKEENGRWIDVGTTFPSGEFRKAVNIDVFASGLSPRGTTSRKFS